MKNKLTDNEIKEFVKSMRENAIKNEQGNIVCSPELWELISSILENTSKTQADAIKEFAERLCEDRVANDPIVIAVKCELKEMVDNNDL